MGLGPCTINGVAFTVCTTNGNLQQRRVLSLASENARSAALIGILDEYTNDGDLNREAFAVPAPGMSARACETGLSVRATGTGSASRLRRLISLTGTQNIELRIEAFNLLNSFSWGTAAAGSPRVNLTSGQFGRITTQQGDPRIMRFGIKYAF